ncbi:histidine kinase [Streptomyces sp. NPDC093109]|uniref:sensor histidine kinase n=1 Tax=Streptomyces sp. NPDC093109 TaxID=3154977 RepID=UPI0034507505
MLPQGVGVAFGSLTVLVGASILLTVLEILGTPLGAVSRRSVVTALTLLVLMPAVLLGQYALPPYRLPYRWRWGLLGLQFVLTYLPLLVFHHRWVSLLGFLAGAVLLTLPPPSSVLVASVVLGSGPALMHMGAIATHRSPLECLLANVVTATSVFAVAHLALLTARLHGSRSQSAHVARQRERARIARDLHDLLGSSLVAIAAQSELARRDTPRDAPAYRAFGEIAALARRSHEEMRSLSRDGYAATLESELSHTRGLLTGAGIAVQISPLPGCERPLEIAECLNAVLREAIGNVLLHSRATRCAIDVAWTDAAGGADGTDAVGGTGGTDRTGGTGAVGAAVAAHAVVGPGGIRLTVRNDGAPSATSPGSAPGGSGLAGLANRVTALGGHLATWQEDGEFVLVAVLPAAPVRPGSGAVRGATPVASPSGPTGFPAPRR